MQNLDFTRNIDHKRETIATARQHAESGGIYGQIARWAIIDHGLVKNLTKESLKLKFKWRWFEKWNIASTRSSRCVPGSLDKKLVEGKIVVCGAVNGTRGAFEAGALGAVVVTNKTQEIAFSFPLPATVISNNPDRSKILIYLNTTSDPTAIIYQGEAAYDSSAPSVASFSSRGPSTVTPLILKPDISAPGVGILAAWSPKGLFSNVKGDKRSVTYNIKSGTSMGCPHVTGAAIYVKTYHPKWSPAAIKSALMTTASPMKNVDPTRGEFAYGAGQVNPVKAVDPGLVYDISENDYVEMLCNKHYSVDALKVITGRNVTCGQVEGDESLLNYPSMTSYVNTKQPFHKYFPRKVTNVGSACSTYKAIISEQPQLNITVTPSIQSFKSMNEQQDFAVNITGGVFETNAVVSTSLTWSDGVHSVRSSIVVLVEVNEISIINT
ncbi:hypothetical protein IFM89_035173 [Coptis chinensis]|uniref:Cucumisin n=1 Tax=Coptis chinensis TaxID=261450 RepID=A0A835MBJ6_9MAGN|nr:hypothetical protein IFM89_035173 [Coptis chinensis]